MQDIIDGQLLVGDWDTNGNPTKVDTNMVYLGGDSLETYDSFFSYGISFESEFFDVKK